MKKLVRCSGLFLRAALAFVSVAAAVAQADEAAASDSAHGLTLTEAQKFVSGFSSSVDTTAKTASIKGSIAKDCVQHFKLESDARVASDNWVRFSLTDVSGEGLRCLEIYRDVCPGDKCVSFDALSNDPKTNTKFRSSVPLLDSEMTRAKVGLVASLTIAPPLTERKPEIRIENLEAAGACAQCKPVMGKTSLDESMRPMTDIVARGLHGLSKSKKMRDRDEADFEDDDENDDEPPMHIARRKKGKSDRYELVDQSAYRQKIQSIMLQGQGQGMTGGIGYESVLSSAFASPYASQYSSMMGMGQSAMMGQNPMMNQSSMFGQSAMGSPYGLTTPNYSQYGSAFSSPWMYGMIPNNYGLSNMSGFFGRRY